MVQKFINKQIFSGADNLDAQEKSQSTFETTVAFKKSSNATYHGADGNPLSKEILADITQFQVIRWTFLRIIVGKRSFFYPD